MTTGYVGLARTAAMTNADQATTPSRARLAIHIGFHKTGTSAIQEALYGARVPLREYGVVYPQAISEHFSHLDLASALGFNPRHQELARHPPEELIERYQRLIMDSPPQSTVILSSEEFSEGNWRPQALENLRAFVEPLDVELLFVAYCRDPLGFLLSIYHHEIRDTASSLTFAEWIETFSLATANFDARLDIWREVFGENAKLLVRDYDAVRAQGRSVVRDLLDTAGLEHADLTVHERHVETGVHPKLVDALLSIRRSDLPEERKLYLQSHLFDIGELMPPVDAASLYLGEAGKTAFQERLRDLPRPQRVELIAEATASV